MKMLSLQQNIRKNARNIQEKRTEANISSENVKRINDAENV